MFHFQKSICFLLLSAALCGSAAPKFYFRTTRVPADGFAKPGERIAFTAELIKDGAPAALPFQAQLTVEGKDVVVKKGNGKISMETTAPSCGFVYFSANYIPEGQKRSVTPPNINSVAVNPEQIRQGMPEPSDFDAFWKAARKELAAIPMNPTLKRIPVTDPKYQGKVDCFEVRLDAPGGRRAFGYLCLPKNAAGKLPAVIRFDGAGIYKHSPEYRFAADGFLALSVNAHGIEFGEQATEEELLSKLKKERYYTVLGWDDPEKVYFRHMLLRDLRALEYLKSRPEWNGKDLICYGSSQGGAQSLAVAGLSPEVTFCYAGVPGLCNHGGIEKKQARGWPGNFPWNAKTKRTAGYFDNCSFARRLRCPVLVTAAWHDFLTKPSSVYAAWNNITSPKELRPFPNAGHWPAIRDTEDYARNEVRKHLKGQAK